MKYKEYKKQLESIKYSKNQIKYKKITTANGNAFDQYDNDCDFERNLQMENNLKRRYYKQEDAKDSFSSCYAKKTNRQNSAFHSAVVQLLPQYNEYLANHGADRFGKLVYNEDTFTSDDGNDISDYEVIGGGGTDFEVNWTYSQISRRRRTFWSI